MFVYRYNTFCYNRMSVYCYTNYGNIMGILERIGVKYG